MTADHQPAKRKRRTSREEDRHRLMDAAEALFADRGFDGVTVRDITQAAGTRLAEVNDQFGSKQELFRCLVSRRTQIINADSHALFASLSKTGTVEERVGRLVDAFANPLLARSQESDGWRAHLRLRALLHVSRSPLLLLLRDAFHPVGHAFCVELRNIFPDAHDRLIFNGYGFLVATAMHVFSNNMRLEYYSGGTLCSDDFEQQYKDMRRFVTGGLIKMCGIGNK